MGTYTMKTASLMEALTLDPPACSPSSTMARHTTNAPSMTPRMGTPHGAPQKLTKVATTLEGTDTMEHVDMNARSTGITMKSTAMMCMLQEVEFSLIYRLLGMLVNIRINLSRAL